MSHGLNGGKGDSRRPTQISRAEEEKRWHDAFGDPKPLNVMSDADREAMSIRCPACDEWTDEECTCGKRAMEVLP